MYAPIPHPQYEVIPEQKPLFERIDPAAAAVAEQVEQHTIVAVQRSAQDVERAFAQLQL
jgi:hypothetical protein